MSHINDKIEEAKTLLGDIAKDIQDVLSLAQFAIPTVEGTVQKVKCRVRQIEKLLSSEESDGDGRAPEFRRYHP